MTDKKEWFESWFDSPFYHLLYKDRDHNEAEIFIDNLVAYLKPLQGDSILDLACGAGRHAIYLNKKGFNVTGVDLSTNSIQVAKNNESEGLHFETHDMREVYNENAFDYILSMFTSFGYFDSEEENLKMLHAVSSGLKQNGTFVLDFLNSKYVINNLIEDEIKTVEGVQFNITRKLHRGHITKKIVFNVGDKVYSFHEQVQAFYLEDLKELFQQAGLTIINTFGTYNLDEFDIDLSERLILIAKKQ